MIWTLFKKECRMLWKSLIFWLYILAVALFFFSQMGTITFEPKPQPEQEGSYGMKLSDKPEDQIQGALGNLAESYFHNSFTTAPIGFNKHVNLNDSEKQKVETILEEMTGLPIEDL